MCVYNLANMILGECVHLKVPIVASDRCKLVFVDTGVWDKLC